METGLAESEMKYYEQTVENQFTAADGELHYFRVQKLFDSAVDRYVHTLNGRKTGLKLSANDWTKLKTLTSPLIELN